MIRVNGKMYSVMNLVAEKGWDFYKANMNNHVKEERECAVCGKAFEALTTSGQKYCNLDCRELHAKNKLRKRNIERINSGKELDMGKSYIALAVC